MGLTDADGSDCYLHSNESRDNITEATNCSSVYGVCRELILETQLTTEACLAGNTSTDGHSGGEDDNVGFVSNSQG